MFSHKSEYRGPPTVELEKRWQELWDCEFLPAFARVTLTK